MMPILVRGWRWIITSNVLVCLLEISWICRKLIFDHSFGQELARYGVDVIPFSVSLVQVLQESALGVLVVVLAFLGTIGELRQWRSATSFNLATYTVLALSTVWGMLLASRAPESVPLLVVVQGVPLLLISAVNLVLCWNEVIDPKRRNRDGPHARVQP